MDVNRSGFYKWRNRMNNVSSKKLQRNNDIELFRQYHLKYPTHGYRWLNAKIKLDLGQTMSDNYAQRCCAFAGIRSVSKRCKYAKPGKKYKIYPNLLLADLAINQPYQVVVSDMTAFWVNKDYYEHLVNKYKYIYSHIPKMKLIKRLTLKLDIKYLDKYINN